jgi:hypothetical protein
MTTSQRKTDAIDELFQLPLADFTAARNSLASRLRKSGKREEADQVKALPKPSISAWAINQLFWKHRKAYDRLMEAGAQLRNAQSSQLAGRSSDVRKPLESRREALTELSRLAASALTHGGHSATPDMMRRVTSTLEALSTLGDSGPPAGHLVDDVEPPGFETLASLVPTAGGSRSRGAGQSTVLPFTAPKRKPATGRGKAETDDDRARREAAERAEAKAAVQAAERALKEARATAERAEAALKKAAAQTKAAEQARVDAEARLEQATAAATEARLTARRVAAEAEAAADALADAERALEKARSGS